MIKKIRYRNTIKAAQWTGENVAELQEVAGDGLRVLRAPRDEAVAVIGGVSVHLGEWLVNSSAGLNVSSERPG